jgi:hypothetical protein
LARVEFQFSRSVEVWTLRKTILGVQGNKEKEKQKGEGEWQRQTDI